MAPKRNTNSSGKISKNSGEIEINRDNWREVKRALTRFLVLEIERAAVLAGSQNQLSLNLGHADNFAQMVLKRGAFSALERLLKEIEKSN